MKLTTPVEFPKAVVEISYGDRIMVLGSCFADNVGKRLKDRGFELCLNPFGTLYNPSSIERSIARLDSGEHFVESDCVQIGSGSTKWGSLHHHTLMARETPEEFLANANESLDRAAEFWRTCNKVIVTFGTSWCFRHIGFGGKVSLSQGDETPRTGDIVESWEAGSNEGFVVSNCLKRDAREFRREFIQAETTAEIVRRMVEEHPDKDFIFTVSPIRHFKDGAHGNQLSKASLLIGLDEALKAVSGQATASTLTSEKQVSGQATASKLTSGKQVSEQATAEQTGSAKALQDCEKPRCDYFPAYEIMLDELRDYRFYAEDMIHPSEQAVNYIFERFIGWALPESEKDEFLRREKVLRQSMHIPIEFKKD